MGAIYCMNDWTESYTSHLVYRVQNKGLTVLDINGHRPPQFNGLL